MSFKEARVERRGLLEDIQQVSMDLARTNLSSELRMALTRNLFLFNKVLNQLNKLLKRMVRISLLERRTSIERLKAKRFNYIGYMKGNLKNPSL
jgi:hypothetical protein